MFCTKLGCPGTAHVSMKVVCVVMAVECCVTLLHALPVQLHESPLVPDAMHDEAAMVCHETVTLSPERTSAGRAVMTAPVVGVALQTPREASHPKSHCA